MVAASACLSYIQKNTCNLDVYIVCNHSVRGCHMKKNVTKFLLAVCAVGMLAGCGSDGSSSTDRTPTPKNPKELLGDCMRELKLPALTMQAGYEGELPIFYQQTDGVGGFRRRDFDPNSGGVTEYHVTTNALGNVTDFTPIGQRMAPIQPPRERKIMSDLRYCLGKAGFQLNAE